MTMARRGPWVKAPKANGFTHPLFLDTHEKPGDCMHVDLALQRVGAKKTTVFEIEAGCP